MRSLRLPAALAALTLAVTACAGGDGGNGDSSGEYPRNETLYTTGTAWGAPANWNPFMQGQYAVGTVGLAYEPLFLFDPNTNEYVPWLAESDSWPEENVHEIVLREGITWSDGEAFDSADVVSTLEIGRFGSVPFSNLWNFIESVEAVDARTVRVTFSENRPQEWMNWVYSHPIAPEHIWAEKTEEQVMSDVNEEPVATGPYVYESHTDDRLVWERNDDWWGTEALGYEMKPRYIVDIVNASNDITLGMLQQGEVDLSNNFLPGIDQIINGNEQITSFYDGPPYMQPANTVWMVPNTTKEPLDDPEFRRALAYSVDMQSIIEGPYTNLVEAADPTGLLPLWDDYIDHDLVAEEGFSYSADRAVEILEDAGYQDEDGDGYVETPDGDPISLTLEVPAGWTDWMEAANVIASNAQAVGINVEAQTPEFDLLVDNRNAGEFDLVLNNERQASNTPWTYYDYLFQLPINDQQTTVNFGRYENEEAWALVEQLAAVPADDIEAAAEITSQLQGIQMAELPAIPLWYNGMWSQASNTYWTNWPSDAEGAPKSAAVMWNGWFQLGAITTLATIEPAGE